MNHLRRILWAIVAVFAVLIVLVMVTFEVDDMTLSDGAVYNFNANWKLYQAGHEVVELDRLPYTGTSKAGETIVIENTIPREFWGLTMSFLSCDKSIRVIIDGKEVYQFGTQDKKFFGNTPGTIVNFVDIPRHLTAGLIRIEMSSAYENSSADIGEICVAERDIAILRLCEDSLVEILCCILIFVAGVIFFILSVIQKLSGQSTDGMPYLGLYCVFSSFFYTIETGIMTIFYGNQTVYSMMSFLIIMLLPYLLILYYERYLMLKNVKRFAVMCVAIIVNIVVQLIEQLFNIVDFISMSYISQVIHILAFWVVFQSFLGRNRRDKNKEKSSVMEVVALLIMMAGAILDLAHTYASRSSDLGYCSIYFMSVACVILVIIHIKQVIREYLVSVEDNAKLLQREVEFVEKQNVQLLQAKEDAEFARKEALSANIAKGKFLAHMSHEIRTPINAVLGMDEMILRECKEQGIREYAMDIRSAGHTLLYLINDILDFSKIESGKMEIIPAEYELSSLIHDIVNMTTVRAKAKDLELEVSVDENLPTRMLGDDVRIRQVLTNILTNAVKYTNQGKVMFRVSGTTRNDMAYLHFEVEDTGIGIKEEDLSKLFVEFERIEENRNRNVEGTGLGMNITTQLLRLMGSKLEVESVYGKGSKFFFELEQPVVDSSPIGNNLETCIKEQSREYDYDTAFIAPDARVLVVDDNAVNRKVFVSLLKETRMAIDEADGGKLCLELVQKTHYDLIFLDHMMPEMDGIETFHHLQKMPDNKCKDTPVIVLTANAVAGAREQYLNEGFDDFLSKPIIPDKLEKLIRTFLPEEKVIGVALNQENAEQQTDNSENPQEEGWESLDKIEGIDWEFAWKHFLNTDIIKYTVKEFYEMIDSEADELDRLYANLYQEGDLDLYRIKVHSMKSSSALIGITGVSAVARMLEYAARDKKTEQIEAIHAVFVEEWRSYKDKLRSFVGAPAEEEKEKVQDTSIILALLDMLRNGMEDMDIDASDETMVQLKIYEYPEDIAEDMKQLGIAVSNLDSEKVIGIIDELMEKVILWKL